MNIATILGSLHQVLFSTVIYFIIWWEFGCDETLLDISLFAFYHGNLLISYYMLTFILLSLLFNMETYYQKFPWFLSVEGIGYFVYQWISVMQIESNDKYADSGPPYLILLHPALGPLWEVTRQKVTSYMSDIYKLCNMPHLIILITKNIFYNFFKGYKMGRLS